MKIVVLIKINDIGNMHRGGSMRAPILPYYTDQDPLNRGQYDGQGIYWGLNTASEVFSYFYYPTVHIF